MNSKIVILGIILIVIIISSVGAYFLLNKKQPIPSGTPSTTSSGTPTTSPRTSSTSPRTSSTPPRTSSTSPRTSSTPPSTTSTPPPSTTSTPPPPTTSTPPPPTTSTPPPPTTSTPPPPTTSTPPPPTTSTPPPTTPPPTTPPPYIDVNCNSEDDPIQFCTAPNSFINLCTSINNTSDDEYASKMRVCINQYYDRVKGNENEYNSARDLLIESNAKYGDSTSQFYIPPTIRNIDCRFMEDQQYFCYKPNEFIQVCSTAVRQDDKDAYFVNKLKDCVLNHRGRITGNLGSYRAARNIYSTKNPTQYTGRTAILPALRINTYDQYINKMNIEL